MIANIERLENLSVESRRLVKTPTNGNEYNKGKKYRRGKQYAKNAKIERQNYIKKQQRKRDKVRYDTHRRYEQTSVEDMKQEDICYANFLGDKYGDNNAPYQKSDVKLKFCDSMRNDYDPYQRAKDEEERLEESRNARLYEMYNQARLQQEETRNAWLYEMYNHQTRLQEEEEERLEVDMSELEYEDQSKNYCITLLMRSGNFDYDVAFELVDYLFTQKYSLGFNDEDWLPWLAKFGITPVDLYGESYY